MKIRVDFYFTSEEWERISKYYTKNEVRQALDEDGMFIFMDAFTNKELTDDPRYEWSIDFNGWKHIEEEE